jgi:glycosyltransferase involved in cell wall biosynthesis
LCLESLVRLNYPRERFEVIVVNDGSKVPPEEIVLSFQDRLDTMLITQPHAGAGAARNAGAGTTRSDWLVGRICRVCLPWAKA